MIRVGLGSRSMPCCCEKLLGNWLFQFGDIIDDRIDMDVARMGRSGCKLSIMANDEMSKQVWLCR